MIIMSEVTVKLRISEEILKKVDLERIIERIEHEIMVEYSIEKLYGSMKEKKIDHLLKEVEEEWST